SGGTGAADTRPAVPTGRPWAGRKAASWPARPRWSRPPATSRRAARAGRSSGRTGRFPARDRRPARLLAAGPGSAGAEPAPRARRLSGVKPGKPHSFCILLGALIAAGCGTAASAPPAGTGASPAASATPVTVSGQAPGPARRAAADARAILGKFVPPPGAVRLAGKPALPGGSPTMGLSSATQADATAYWRASGAPTTLRAWEKARVAGSFARQDVIAGPPSWNTLYSLPAVPGVLPTR